jgi:hypothetical protein
MTDDRKSVSNDTPAHARKPWTAPRIQDAPVSSTTAKTASTSEGGIYVKGGS